MYHKTPMNHKVPINKEHNTLLGWLILCVCLLLGNSLSGYLKTPIPGPLLGMILLLGLCFMVREPLTTNVRRVSNSIIPYLSLSILPVCIQIIHHWAVLQTEGLRILAVLFLSLIIGLVATGWSFQWVSCKMRKRTSENADQQGNTKYSKISQQD